MSSSFEDLGPQHVGMFLDEEPDPVIALAIDRLKNPQNKLNERAKLVRAIEGGGFSVIVPAAMLVVMEQAGFNEVIAEDIGSSIGSLAAAYADGRQAALGSTCFFDLIHKRQFSRPERMLVCRPMIDLSCLLCDIVTNNKPLTPDDPEKDPSFGAVVTNVDTGEAELLMGFKNVAAKTRAIRASSAVPVHTGPPIEYEGITSCSDGGLVAPMPFEVALQHGSPDNTHVLVLRTCGEDLRKNIDPWALIEAVRWHRFGSKALAKLVEARAGIYNEDAYNLKAGLIKNVTQVALKGSDRPVPRVTKSLRTLEEGFVLGMRAAGKVFGMPELFVVRDKRGVPKIRTNNQRPKKLD